MCAGVGRGVQAGSGGKTALERVEGLGKSAAGMSGLRLRVRTSELEEMLPPFHSCLQGSFHGLRGEMLLLLSGPCLQSDLIEFKNKHTAE